MGGRHCGGKRRRIPQRADISHSTLKKQLMAKNTQPSTAAARPRRCSELSRATVAPTPSERPPHRTAEQCRHPHPSWAPRQPWLHSRQSSAPNAEQRYSVAGETRPDDARRPRVDRPAEPSAGAPTAEVAPPFSRRPGFIARPCAAPPASSSDAHNN